MQMPFDITARALEEVRLILERKQIPDGYSLRVGIRGTAGCAGVAFLIGFDKAKDTDLQFEQEGISIVMEKKHALYLAGVTVDWEEQETQRGFAFVK